VQTLQRLLEASDHASVHLPAVFECLVALLASRCDFKDLVLDTIAVALADCDQDEQIYPAIRPVLVSILDAEPSSEKMKCKCYE
jgi:hypothetical protein